MEKHRKYCIIPFAERLITESHMKKFFAGIDLGGTKILTVITDSDRSVLSKIRVPSESLRGVDHVIGNMF